MNKAASSRAVEGAIFEAALSLDDPGVRADFLEKVFRGDPGGLEQMQELLESTRDAIPFFLEAREVRGHIASELFSEMSPDGAAGEGGIPASPERIGSSIANYQLIRCLGAGGSGIVYEAEQLRPVQRRVALKILHIDTGSDSAKVRFEIERQALAIMDHPNIAKVLDAGGIHHGDPYFVMELIQGESITKYCDVEKMEIRRRIELFVDVCDAIQHAHSKRIIHRDIKPSNVLVTIHNGRPVAKVIDFGIAKAVAPTLKVEPLLTAHDQFVGTPAYMSPEQVEMIGVDVDTRSDIYSLGVLLYELLTSHTPFDRAALVDSGISGMRRMILDVHHPKPSTRLASLGCADLGAIAEARSTDPSRLPAVIQGDLDMIVMKALEKDRNRRYETANGLAADLRRYLGGQPVSARKPSNLYLFKKFIGRNKVPFYCFAAVAVSVVLGFGTSMSLYFRERSALEEQERLSIQAERARDQEQQLRRQAQARANVSRVAFLLSEGHVEEADELLQGNPLKSIEPSKEASSVFRGLGNWYATYGRWEEAVQCFRLMNQATKLNSPAEILRGADLLTTAPALVKFGDLAGYDAFRKDAITRLLPVSDSVSAEHILKASLLSHLSPQWLDRLDSAAAYCEQGIHEKSRGTFPAWEAFSLALYHYRKGNFPKVLEVGELGLALPEIKEICAASIRVLTAESHHRLGNNRAAAEDLKWATSVIRKDVLGNPAEENSALPRWYDWSVASILLAEVEASIGTPQAGD